MASTPTEGWNAFLHVDALFYQAIILLVILYVLNKFLFQPYLQYLDEYSKKQKKIEDDYRNIDALVAEAEAKKESILEEARATGDAIISDAETIAAKKKAQILEKADKEAQDVKNAGLSDIEQERKSMLGQVKGKVVDLILQFNSKLFDNEKVSKDFLEKNWKDSDLSK